MAKNKEESTPKLETKASVLDELLSSVSRHFSESKSELDIRITHKEQGFDEYDYIYRSYIRKDKWPFNTRIFIPLSFAAIYSKGTRQITGKIKGRLSATQFGNDLSARIGSELLSAQYEDHDFHFEEAMISKWFRMDQNARKYGAAFGLVPWMKDGEFDGPSFIPLDNRKVFFPVGVSSISDCEYVIVERNKRIDQLLSENEAATKKHGQPLYFQTAIDTLKKIKNNQYSESNLSVNGAIRSLTNKRNGFRVLTEYRKDKWITWCPDIGDPKGGKATLGLVLRVVNSPYRHKLIPIIRLVYIPIDDDIYGVSELEPVRSQQKATNALVSGFIEAVSTELYPIVKGHPTNVDWKTVEFKPRAAWIMNNPASDVVRLEGGVTFTRTFVEAYRLLKSSFAEGLGESAADASNLSALQADKTATEVKDTALLRSARDNLNKLFLAAAIQKMYSFWWSMDQQFMTDKKMIKISGKDAIEYFVNEGLNGYELDNEGYEQIKKYMDEHPGVDFEIAYEVLREDGTLDKYAKPLFTGTSAKLPKLQLERDGKSGFLSVENKDLTGQYRFVVDLNTIGMPNDAQEVQVMKEYAKDTFEAQKSGMLGDWKVKGKELLESIGEKMKIHNVENFFEKVEPQQGMMSPNGMPQQMGMQGNGGQPGPAMPQQLTPGMPPEGMQNGIASQ